MLEPGKLNYVILPSAEIVEFNNKINIQRLIGDVNALRDHNRRKCRLLLFAICSKYLQTQEEKQEKVF